MKKGLRSIWDLTKTVLTGLMLGLAFLYGNDAASDKMVELGESEVDNKQNSSKN